MIFVLKMLLTFVYDRKNENHWSLLITHYSLLITHYSLLGIQTPTPHHTIIPEHDPHLKYIEN